MQSEFSNFHLEIFFIAFYIRSKHFSSLSSFNIIERLDNVTNTGS